jgi:transposase
VVAWATDALDEVRRAAWNAAPSRLRGLGRGSDGGRGVSAQFKRCRYALWKNPAQLTAAQQAQLAWVAKTDPRLYRAYLFKEGLRHVFALGGPARIEALDHWLAWARRCRIPHFVALGRRIKIHRDAIRAALEHGLSNALAEAVNTKIRLVARLAYGFRNTNALIALALLTLGGHRAQLPCRTYR